MKQTMRLKLAPTPEQAQALLDTMYAFNEAVNFEIPMVESVQLTW
jgi:predicted transposase